ncbi:putative potassium/sodium hyperpolarization-activated cyclic [Sesbania bispinosa]|nr:putative potassium/sodium hyperpolarization-activated cyclic [Sesbania bispinosa]
MNFTEKNPRFGDPKRKEGENVPPEAAGATASKGGAMEERAGAASVQWRSSCAE